MSKKNSTSIGINNIQIPDWQLEVKPPDNNDDSVSEDYTNLINSDVRADLTSAENLGDSLEAKPSAEIVSSVVDNSILALSSSNSEESQHMDTDKDTQPSRIEESNNLDIMNEPIDKPTTGSIVEETMNSTKKRYRVDPDLLIGYSRKRII